MDQKIFIAPSPLGPVKSPTAPNAVKPNAGSNFDSLLHQEIKSQNEVKFSAHAMKRLETRNIHLSKDDLHLLNEAVARADSKGSRESLILMDQLAFIVSVKNRTVITAVDGQSLKDNVFTNIDSAVIAK